MRFGLTVLNIYVRFYVCLNEAKTIVNCGKYTQTLFLTSETVVVIDGYLLYELKETAHRGLTQFNYNRWVEYNSYMPNQCDLIAIGKHRGHADQLSCMCMDNGVKTITPVQ